MTRRALGLVADEQDVVPRVMQHGLEVVDDAATCAHAVARDDDGGTCGLGQVVDHGDVVGVVVDHDQVVERQRVAPCFGALAGFLIPVGLQAAVGRGEAAGQRGVEDDGQLWPVGG